MFPGPVLNRIAHSFALPTDNPDLLKAQCKSLSRFIPLMYLALVVNGWVLAVDFHGQAPDWLTVVVSLLLTAAFVGRLVVWWRMRNVELTTERAIRELRRVNRFAIALALTALGWALALYPHGDEAARVHVLLFVTISMTSSMLCLTYLHSAAVIVALVPAVPIIAFFSVHGAPLHQMLAVNIIFVSVVALVVIRTQGKDFDRLVVAQSDALRREREQSRLLHMIDDMPVAVMTVDPETLRINYLNETSRSLIRRIEHLLPITADEILGASIDVFHKHPEHQRALLSDPARLPHNARIKLGPEVLDLQISAVHDDDGAYLGPMLSWAIVTKEVETETEISRLAHSDTLTCLPNRYTFHRHFEAVLAPSDARVALLLIDLDGFKYVNDTQGHGVGDALLRQVADRLREKCEVADAFICRLGGDEFAVLLSDADARRAADFAQRLVDALGAPYSLQDDRHVQIGASVGIALAPEHGQDTETLLSRGDIALYAAKAMSKEAVRIFLPEMEVRVHERVQLETKLRAALRRRDELFVFYQPIVDIRTGKITAREALIRWHQPEHGWISPAEFIPVAEQCGLIDQLGWFVLNRACHDAAGWDDDARVAVNISAGQFGRGALPSEVLAALVDSGLSPERLEIEITETALIGEEVDAIGELRRMRDLGVRVALDDFGTGYSSLAHLRAFPFDKIKIDGSFVQDAIERPDCAAIVRTVADLGRRLGATTVAEGVESQAQFDCALAEGCDEVQGYMFGIPAPSDRDLAVVEELKAEAASASAA
ncbi:EAL domain-containing protein [Oricola sp.]|uniref:putative bifunctional diguanylate cyclase/phosphodiesterase n=1 Tax=Oricola sp. TaxID=1979950 RepID=UPI0025CF60CC|nr:EAL domain-containing protein [Oricola sp.]